MSLHLKMTEEQQFLLDATNQIDHLNVHALTISTQGEQESFRSVWFGHTPQAARYMLFAQLCNGKVKLR